jgi:3-deoxy-D-manno-octulosonic-acid transferase
MYVLYSFALSILFCALLPYFIYQALTHGKYTAGFKERAGRIPIQSDARKTIWLHAVSVGEFLEATPLLQRLKAEFPACRLVVSTTTLTGQRLARSSSNLDATFYFPFDWKFAVRRALDRVKPSIVIILETELWPNFLRECRRRDVIVILANGRISERSFRRYLRVRSFIKRVVADFSIMLMQTDADAERALRLGATRVRTTGNLKYDVEVEPSTSNTPVPSNTSRDIDHQFGLSASPRLIVAGSTAPGEEEMLLAALAELRRNRGLENVRLLIAPRHPERFQEVAGLISRSEFSYARRSDAWQSSASMAGGKPSQMRPGVGQPADQVEVILLDSIGDLASAYRFAEVVFVGGSLVPRGGHNVIEPAAFAKPIIVGPHTDNFRQIVSDFARADALLQVQPNELTTALVGLLSHPDRAREMGERARNILLANRGATDRTIREIKAATKSI